MCIAPCTYHGQVKKRSSINRHGRENWSNDITNNRHERLVGAIDVVTIFIIRYDGRLCHIHMQVLEHVCPVAEIQENRLVPVLWQSISLQQKNSPLHTLSFQ